MYSLTNCRTCPKNIHCCIFKDNKGFAFLTVNDARLIKKKINKDYSHFLNYSPLSNKIISAMKKEEPCLEGALRYLQLDKKRLLRLKTKEEGRCIFLNKKGKCDIYSIRPNICRIYPFWAMRLFNKKLKVIEHNINMKCSIIYKKEVEQILSAKQADEVKNIFKKIEKEAKEYKKGISEFVSQNNLK